MELKDEIKSKRNEIIVDSYPMSIGEIMNIYKEEELDVHPEFQRFFRWDIEQKTKLIESILLGIPIPPIFVAQKTNGKWEVIDGQQRLSTILQFLGVLKNDSGELQEPLVLIKTKFLPLLDGVGWNEGKNLSDEQKITFKREKLNFTIIKEKSDDDTSKYEMFQRINTNGLQLSPQELRNCLLIMINKQLYEDISNMSKVTDFINCFNLSDRKKEERFDIELVVRFILYNSFTLDFLDTLDTRRNMDNFLTEEIENLAINDRIYDYIDVEKFKELFGLLNSCLGISVFKRYKDGVFVGSSLINLYEAIVPGVYQNLSYWQVNESKLKNKITTICGNNEYEEATKRGIRSLDRMQKLIKFSRMWFKHED